MHKNYIVLLSAFIACTSVGLPLLKGKITVTACRPDQTDAVVEDLHVAFANDLKKWKAIGSLTPENVAASFSEQLALCARKNRVHEDILREKYERSWMRKIETQPYDPRCNILRYACTSKGDRIAIVETFENSEWPILSVCVENQPRGKGHWSKWLVYPLLTTIRCMYFVDKDSKLFLFGNRENYIFDHDLDIMGPDDVPVVEMWDYIADNPLRDISEFYTVTSGSICTHTTEGKKFVVQKSNVVIEEEMSLDAIIAYIHNKQTIETEN